MKIEIVKRSSLHILQKTFRFLTTVFNGEKKNRDNAEHILVYERYARRKTECEYFR